MSIVGAVLLLVACGVVLFILTVAGFLWRYLANAARRATRPFTPVFAITRDSCRNLDVEPDNPHLQTLADVLKAQATARRHALDDTAPIPRYH